MVPEHLDSREGITFSPPRRIRATRISGILPSLTEHPKLRDLPTRDTIRNQHEGCIGTNVPRRRADSPDRHDGTAACALRATAARIVQRLLALNASIWHNWLIGAPVKRSLIAYDHVSP